MRASQRPIDRLVARQLPIGTICKNCPVKRPDTARVRLPASDTSNDIVAPARAEMSRSASRRMAPALAGWPEWFTRLPLP
jgi:hypothetical protein